MDNDWDINPDSYVKDSEGNFVLKLDGTPKKKGGRPKGSTNKKKIESSYADFNLDNPNNMTKDQLLQLLKQALVS